MTEEQKLPKKIAEKHKIEESRIKLANRSMFDYIKEQMESGNRKPVRLPKAGLFSCKLRRVQELDKRNLL